MNSLLIFPIIGTLYYIKNNFCYIRNHIRKRKCQEYVDKLLNIIWGKDRLDFNYVFKKNKIPKLMYIMGLIKKYDTYPYYTYDRYAKLILTMGNIKGRYYIINKLISQGCDIKKIINYDFRESIYAQYNMKTIKYLWQINNLIFYNVYGTFNYLELLSYNDYFLFLHIGDTKSKLKYHKKIKFLLSIGLKINRKWCSKSDTLKYIKKLKIVDCYTYKMNFFI